MKKEILISIVIGIILGLVLTFIIYQTKKTVDNTNEPIQSPLADTEVEGPSPTPLLVDSLTILSPLDQSINSEQKQKISGKTAPLSKIIILTEKGEKIIESNSEGKFETEINLVAGENEITIKSISENGNESEKVLTVVYSEAVI